jgi:two-component system response regulator YesN
MTSTGSQQEFNPVSRPARVQPVSPGLYGRIRFDLDLEAEALARLAELDLDGCRARFGRLVDGLDLRPAGARDGEVALLLLDVLQHVNRKVHHAPAEDGAYQTHRAELLERFTGVRDAEQARRAFMPALNRLLSGLSPRPVASHHLVDAARAFIDENYPRRISLSSVASRLHVSPNHLSRIFKKATGRTLTQYVQSVRLEHAMALLAAGGRSISEIAYLVGYQNYRDFYRNFVKYKNASPRQMRRRLTQGDFRAASPDGQRGSA